MLTLVCTGNDEHEFNRLDNLLLSTIAKSVDEVYDYNVDSY